MYRVYLQFKEKKYKCTSYEHMTKKVSKTHFQTSENFNNIQN